MRGILAFLILVLCHLVPVYGQVIEPKLLNHPGLTPEKIQSEFVLGHWILKKAQFVKIQGKVDCFVEIFAYGQKNSVFRDDPFCIEETEEYANTANVDLVYTIVFSRKFAVAMSGQDKFVLPSQELIVSGYRRSVDGVDFRASGNPIVDLFISEIYSLDFGRVRYIFGQKVDTEK